MFRLSVEVHPDAEWFLSIRADLHQDQPLHYSYIMVYHS